jgi:hypothetical protein
VLLGNGDGTFQTTFNVSYVAGGSPRSVAAGDFNGDGAPDLAVATDTNDVSIFLNDGIWNGPAPRPGHVPGLTFGALPSALPPQQQSEPPWYEASAPVDLPTNPLPHQPLLDWLRPASNAAEPHAFSHPLARSQAAWDAFFSAGLFDFNGWDLLTMAFKGSPPVRLFETT